MSTQKELWHMLTAPVLPVAKENMIDLLPTTRLVRASFRRGEVVWIPLTPSGQPLPSQNENVLYWPATVVDRAVLSKVDNVSSQAPITTSFFSQVSTDLNMAYSLEVMGMDLPGDRPQMEEKYMLPFSARNWLQKSELEASISNWSAEARDWTVDNYLRVQSNLTLAERQYRLYGALNQVNSNSRMSYYEGIQFGLETIRRGDFIRVSANNPHGTQDIVYVTTIFEEETADGRVFAGFIGKPFTVSPTFTFTFNGYTGPALMRTGNEWKGDLSKVHGRFYLPWFITSAKLTPTERIENRTQMDHSCFDDRDLCQIINQVHDGKRPRPSSPSSAQSNDSANKRQRQSSLEFGRDDQESSAMDIDEDVAAKYGDKTGDLKMSSLKSKYGYFWLCSEALCGKAFMTLEGIKFHYMMSHRSILLSNGILEPPKSTLISATVDKFEKPSGDVVCLLDSETEIGRRVYMKVPSMEVDVNVTIGGMMDSQTKGKKSTEKRKFKDGGPSDPDTSKKGVTTGEDVDSSKKGRSYKRVSKEVTAILLEAYKDRNYPGESEKALLHRLTRLTMDQVTNWFTNHRMLLKKKGIKPTHVEGGVSKSDKTFFDDLTEFAAALGYFAQDSSDSDHSESIAEGDDGNKGPNSSANQQFPRAIGKKNAAPTRSMLPNDVSQADTDVEQSQQDGTEEDATTYNANKKRRTLSTTQKSMLMDAYLRDPLLKPETLKDLIAISGLDSKTIRTWFINRRRPNRSKAGHDSRALSSSTATTPSPAKLGQSENRSDTGVSLEDSLLRAFLCNPAATTNDLSLLSSRLEVELSQVRTWWSTQVTACESEMQKARLTYRDHFDYSLREVLKMTYFPGDTVIESLAAKFRVAISTIFLWFSQRQEELFAPITSRPDLLALLKTEFNRFSSNPPAEVVASISARFSVDENLLRNWFYSEGRKAFMLNVVPPVNDRPTTPVNRSTTPVNKRSTTPDQLSEDFSQYQLPRRLKTGQKKESPQAAKPRGADMPKKPGQAAVDTPDNDKSDSQQTVAVAGDVSTTVTLEWYILGEGKLSFLGDYSKISSLPTLATPRPVSCELTAHPVIYEKKDFIPWTGEQ